MPLLRFLSAMTRRLWLALVLLFASFFLRSCTVSRFCPWPFTFPTTAELSCLCLQYTEEGHHHKPSVRLEDQLGEELSRQAPSLGSPQLCSSPAPASATQPLRPSAR